MGGEFQLPEPIIQHIQSFLNGKEAARTTLLSSSWRKAWLTRPDIDFSDYDDTGPFEELATKTIQRYEKSNLKIQSLRLFIGQSWCYEITLYNELISKALKLGATHLSLELGRKFVVPREVFGSENLVGLSVIGCEIDIGSDRKAIRCSRLESLCLQSTEISLDTLSHIIPSCPSIQKLSLSNIVSFEEQGVTNSVGDGLINLHCLTCLELVYVKFDTLFLGDVSSRFPSLKDLTLHMYSTSFAGEEEIRISSSSLERLNFAQTKCSRRHRFGDAQKRRLRVKFDVPSIRRFTYDGRVIPLLSFKSTSREWESRVSIVRYNDLGSLWFRRLSKFLTKLRRSKIHLSLNVSVWRSFDYEAGEVQGLRRPRVENLTIDLADLPYLNCYALFDGLFQMCRPKFITQYLHHKSRVDGKEKREYFLCKAFLGRGGNESHFMYYGLEDLEEVNVEIWDEVVAVWRHVPLEYLLDASTNATTDKRKIRFQLKWRR
ncbi:putative F-box/LRR-repeat protein at3g18150 [Phtheirospermum japonicum]|uniref:Putative F-box/LRR-repeat protein at3g18150 n=1 Tax=Phtheirospermum japonicum TaxID=374723 RepID=A0A830C398_9LAMI|nr:putative F-box/LRR-repeat protein at3g18150 [Phtheirospermum japonicum]